MTISKWLLLMTGLVCLCQGCGKKSTNPDTSSVPPPETSPVEPAASKAEQAAPPIAQQPNAKPQPRSAPQSNLGTPIDGKVDPQMTYRLRQFMSNKGRLPQSVLELGGETGDTLPRAPEGLMFVIDTATAEVKLVKR